MKTQLPIRPDVLEEAAGWLVEFRSGDPQSADRRDFDRWLRASPEHVRAYLTLLPTWENGAQLNLDPRPDADTLIRLARGDDDNIVHFGARPRHVALRASPRARVRLLVAAAALVAIVVGTYFGYSAWRNPVYTTDTGEQRSLSLADGSTVELNSRSRLRIRFTERERAVELLEGQALFNVAKNSARPFVVRSDRASVRAVGTQFDVYRKSTGTIVTVVEGRVAILPSSSSTAAPSAAPILLDAGQQLTVNPAAPRVPTRVNLKTATAWTQRRLIFSAAPLADVAAEFNRYNTRRLVIDSAELESFRLNGIFSSANPSALLGFLREQPGITVTESDTTIRVSRK